MVTFSFIALARCSPGLVSLSGGLWDCRTAPWGTGYAGVVCHSRPDIRRTASLRLSGFRSTIVEPPVAPADLAGVLGGDEGHRAAENAIERDLAMAGGARQCIEFDRRMQDRKEVLGTGRAERAAPGIAPKLLRSRP
jgi:hypothetical protein